MARRLARPRRALPKDWSCRVQANSRRIPQDEAEGQSLRKADGRHGVRRTSFREVRESASGVHVSRRRIPACCSGITYSRAGARSYRQNRPGGLSWHASQIPAWHPRFIQERRRHPSDTRARSNSKAHIGRDRNWPPSRDCIGAFRRCAIEGTERRFRRLPRRSTLRHSSHLGLAAARKQFWPPV